MESNPQKAEPYIWRKPIKIKRPLVNNRKAKDANDSCRINERLKYELILYLVPLKLCEEATIKPLIILLNEVFITNFILWYCRQNYRRAYQNP